MFLPSSSFLYELLASPILEDWTNFSSVSSFSVSLEVKRLESIVLLGKERNHHQLWRRKDRDLLFSWDRVFFCLSLCSDSAVLLDDLAQVWQVGHREGMMEWKTKWTDELAFLCEVRWQEIVLEMISHEGCLELGLVKEDEVMWRALVEVVTLRVSNSSQLLQNQLVSSSEPRSLGDRCVLLLLSSVLGFV